MTALYIAFGGAIGAVLRYLVSASVAFPFGTLCVNVLGSFLMGVAFVYLSARDATLMSFFVMTGVLGGFTTFSAFSLDTFKLIEAGKWLPAGGYVVASVVLSLAAVFFGIGLMKAVMS